MALDLTCRADPPGQCRDRGARLATGVCEVAADQVDGSSPPDVGIGHEHGAAGAAHLPATRPAASQVRSTMTRRSARPASTVAAAGSSPGAMTTSRKMEASALCQRGVDRRGQRDDATERADWVACQGATPRRR